MTLLLVKFIKYVKINLYMTKNELLIYFATVSLIFTLIFFIPFLGLILYNATYLPSWAIFDFETKGLSHNYKWKYNNTYYGAGNYGKLQDFKAMLSEIERLNAMESSNVYGLTKFSNMSKHEFAKQMLYRDDYAYWGRKSFVLRNACTWSSWFSMLEKRYSDDVHSVDIPQKFDWRDQGVVSPVLDQKRCLACWAFGVVGLMETMVAIKRNERRSVQLSIQELIDCSPHTEKCHGGNIFAAMYYLCTEHKPIVLARRYPLTLHEESCQLVGEKVPGTRLRDFNILKDVNDEHEIPRIIATHGPVMVALSASMWQYYTGGIINRACKRNDDGYQHIVQIVGYDMTGDIPYYIIKNSWGTDFGEDGYVRLAMFQDACGIRREVAYLDVY